MWPVICLAVVCVILVEFHKENKLLYINSRAAEWLLIMAVVILWINSIRAIWAKDWICRHIIDSETSQAYSHIINRCLPKTKKKQRDHQVWQVSKVTTRLDRIESHCLLTRFSKQLKDRQTLNIWMSKIWKISLKMITNCLDKWIEIVCACANDLSFTS